MADEIWHKSGTEWQNFISRLLKRHYGNSYQEVPDRDGGDYGIEGFSISDQTVYQCYAAEEPLTTKALYEKQRDKTTTDIKKFIRYRDQLSSLFGNIKIERWVLVVPRFESSKLIKHAAQKTEEVKNSNLPYVTENFRVTICTANVWEIERKELMNSQLEKLHIHETADVSIPIEGSHLLENLRRKLRKLTNDEKTIKSIEQKFWEHYVDSEAKLSILNEQYPDYYVIYRQTKIEKEKYLEIDRFLTSAAPKDFLKSTLDTFQSTLESELPGVSETTIKALSQGTLSSWLLHCPLDFTD